VAHVAGEGAVGTKARVRRTTAAGESGGSSATAVGRETGEERLRRKPAPGGRKRERAARGGARKSSRSGRRGGNRRDARWSAGWVLAARLLEHLVSGALVVAAILAVLGVAGLDGRPWTLVAALGAATVAAVAFAVAVDRLRLGARPPARAALDALLLAALAGLVAWSPPRRTLARLNEIAAGERATQERVIRHQVWAAYRRMDRASATKLVERGEGYAPVVEEAARAFGVDPELLMGVAATESSFLPRDSADGGHGLFQVTAVPASATARAKQVLGVAALDLADDRHNATVAAATLAEYAGQMKGDLFLTLLAYNIGPANGGLRTIMDQYGARNFAQVQPWLQPLPRDYPVRVLSSALAWRVWRRFHRLPAFEDPEGGRLVQESGIPGLDDDAWRVGERGASGSVRAPDASGTSR